jgi:PII-like signaling protein
MDRLVFREAVMSKREVTIARVYTLEGHDHLNQVLDVLQNQQKVIGVTVVRGIAGVGASGEMHTSSLLNLSLELPLVIEFHDEPEKVEKAIEVLKTQLDLKHIVSWPATAHIDATS